MSKLSIMKRLQVKLRGVGKDTHGYRHTLPQVVCSDGTGLSIQAGKLLYSTPRSDTGPWTAVEVGFPTVVPPDSWQQYSENWEDPTGTIYTYIPLELVAEFIADHGGFRREL